MAKQCAKRIRYASNKTRFSRLLEDLSDGAAEVDRGQIDFDGFGGFRGSTIEAPKSVSTVALHNGLRRYGIEGEESFLVLASRYLELRQVASSKLRYFPLERARIAFKMVARDKQVVSIVDEIVATDPTGRELPSWYQFFIGRRFREGSGKFFTPLTVAG